MNTDFWYVSLRSISRREYYFEAKTSGLGLGFIESMLRAKYIEAILAANLIDVGPTHRFVISIASKYFARFWNFNEPQPMTWAPQNLD